MRGLFGGLRDAVEGKATALLNLPDFLTWPSAKSGQSVTYATALQVSTVMAIVRVLSEGGAQVPWKLYRSGPNGRIDEARDHPAFNLLYLRPNTWQTAFEFREQRMMHLVLTGNAFAYKSFIRGRIKELIPLEPGQVSVKQNADKTLAYEVLGGDGSKAIPAALIWHSRGPSWNGWMGLDAVRYAREAIGLGMALEESHARLHKNGTQVSGTYSVEGALNEQQHASLTKWIKQNTTGENAGAPLVLDRGAKWLTQQMSGVDAQHVETRKLQIEEMCRAFRVFPQMVGHSDKTATFASAEAFFSAHVMHSLAPWAQRNDQSATVNLLTEEEQKTLYFKHALRGLMRGALKDQAEYYAKALGSGGSPAWLTQDEVRGYEELNPMGGAAGQLREPSNVGDPASLPAA